MTPGTILTAALNLSPLPAEGGWFRRTYAGDRHSTILFLVADGEFSALHRLTAPEEYSYLAGAPLALLLLDRAGSRTVLLDPQNPRITVPAGSWQGSSSTAGWTLVTTTVTPAFDWSMFELGDRAALQQRWPEAAARIAALTRVQP